MAHCVAKRCHGPEPVSSTPTRFGDFMRAEIRQWNEVVKAAGIAPN